MRVQKTIAVVAADVFNEYINKIMQGISEQGNSLGYDVAVFMMTFNNDNDSLLQKGEENIYSLLNSKKIDGVVFICGNINRKGLVSKLENRLVELGIPLVAVDCENDLCESVNAEDTPLFEMMTDHFIEVHGCREIMCLTGFESVPQSHTRAEGYKNSLRKHNIPVKDELIVYGDFWQESSKMLAEEFADGRRKLPEAIVCANDSMAIALCDSLVSMGIRVPEDVLVSGYDGSLDAFNNIPSVTTIFPLNYDMGAKAVCYLHEKITGEKTEKVKAKKGYIIKARSCGCGKETEVWLKQRESYENIKQFDKLYRSSGMTERLLEAKSLEELIQKANSFTYLINGLEVYMLCLCENWNSIDARNDDDYIREGYGDNMVIKLVREAEDYHTPDVLFKAEEIIPAKMREYSPEPSTFFLLPMHFEDRCFGYSIFKFADVKYSLSSVFAAWCRNINISLEFMRVRAKLMNINQKIFINSIRDTLTGIYNNKGFRRFSDGIFRTAKNEKRRLLVMVADLDMLKYINDNYGHVEGDNAITVAANILNKCCQNNEICARIGGDEYVIVGCHDYTDEMIKEYLDFIGDYLERYNTNSGKPYQVGVSLGYYCGVPEEDSQFSDYFKIADSRMYQNKFERRKCREN